METSAEHRFMKAAAKALNGHDETLWLAIHDRLRRAPASVDECEREIKAFSPADRQFYGIQPDGAAA